MPLRPLPLLRAGSGLLSARPCSTAPAPREVEAAPRCPLGPPLEHVQVPPRLPSPPVALSFDDPREAFRSKSSWELLRSLLVFRMCACEPLVERGQQLMNISRKVLGQKLFEKMMKMTFYGQFVAGEDQESIKPLIRRNRAFGVGSVLDYSVEEDLTHEEAEKKEMESCTSEAEKDGAACREKKYQVQPGFGDRRGGVTCARTYFYADEGKCDHHMETFLRCIEASGGSSEDGFSAIKLTALGRPQFLLQFSEVLIKWRRFFHQLAADQGKKGVAAVDIELEVEKLQDSLAKLGIATKDEIQHWFTGENLGLSGTVDLLDWNSLIDSRTKISKLLLVPNLQTGHLEPLLSRFTEEEDLQMKRMLQRMDVLAKKAVETGVRLMVDAEQTYFQPAISRLALEMQRKFNTENPIIFNTYQCYLKEAYDNVTADVELSRREGWYFGGIDPEISSIVLGDFEKKAVQKVQRVLPQWLSHPSLVQKGIKKHLVPIHEVPGIHPKLLKKLQGNKIQSFFPVQAEVIPAILESTCHGFLVGRGGYCPSDICVSAPTGSGKTLAFVIPVIQALLERVACRVRALVVLPTKELAQQVCKVFNVYTDGTSLKVVMVTGQKSFAKEQETLVEKTMMGNCSLADIVVATPGRLVDHIEQTPGFCLRQLRFLIIDEADRMMDSLSQDWLNQVTRAVYRDEEGSDPNLLFTRTEPGPLTAASTCFPRMPLQKLLFSATLTQNPEKLQQLGLYQPRLFTSVYGKDQGSTEMGQDTERNYTLPEGLTQYYVPCNLNSKPLILLHFLVTLKFTRVLCFTNSREASHRLFLLVRAFGGVCAAEFSSRLSPGERQRTLKEFEQGKLQILISTDATARGIDIKGVKCVINYDAPQFIRVYIHRVGRTARAGKSGLAFTMLLNVQEHRYLRMMKDAGTSELQKQLVKSENLKPLLERYERALSELQRTVKDERVKKRA